MDADLAVDVDVDVDVDADADVCLMGDGSAVVVMEPTGGDVCVCMLTRNSACRVCCMTRGGMDVARDAVGGGVGE